MGTDAMLPPDAVLELFRHAEWARHRTRESVVDALAQTPVVLTAWQGERCVGLPRVLTDGVYRALIEDVIVHPDHRGSGCGRRVVEMALAHPRVREVEVVFLFAGVPEFYARFEFVPDPTGVELERGGNLRGKGECHPAATVPRWLRAMPRQCMQCLLTSLVIIARADWSASWPPCGGGSVNYGLELAAAGECGDPRSLAELARIAESSGWDGGFLEDYIVHWNSGAPTYDPWVGLAAMALATERIRIGMAVTPLPRRRP